MSTKKQENKYPSNRLKKLEREIFDLCEKFTEDTDLVVQTITASTIDLTEYDLYNKTRLTTIAVTISN